MLGRDNSELLSSNCSDKGRRAWRLLIGAEAAGDAQASSCQEWRVHEILLHKGAAQCYLLSMAAESTSCATSTGVGGARRRATQGKASGIHPLWPIPLLCYEEAD